MYSPLMTKEKKDAIIGRLTRECSAAREDRNLHERALREASLVVESLTHALRRMDAPRVIELLNSVDFEEIRTTAENLQKAAAAFESLKNELRDCGVIV